MMRARRRFDPAQVLAALLFGGFAAVSAPATADDHGLVTHRAIYALSLSKDAPAGGGVANAHGKMEYEWADVCDGWATRQRALVVVTHADGSRVDFGWSMNTWESKDGLKYRFQLRTLPPAGDEVTKKGEASLEAPGQPGTASFSEPEAGEVALPAGTVFPSAHNALLLESIETGEMPLWRTIFDGSGENGGLSGTNVALAGEVDAGEPSSIKHPLLEDSESWRVVVAFFGMDKDAVEPETEQRFRFYNNGIVDEVVIDFQDFAVDATMVDLEALPAPAC